MKILHISANGFTVKNLLLPQVDHFNHLGMTVEIGCALGEETQHLQRQGYIIHEVKITRNFNPIANLKDILRLAKFLRQQQYDILHVHTPFAAFIGRIAAKLAGTHHTVYTAHGFPFHPQSTFLSYWVYFLLEKLAAPLCDLILTQSYEDLITARLRRLCPPQKIQHLGNGVNIDRFCRSNLNPSHQIQLRQSLGIPRHAGLVIGTIGRLTYKKGSGFLIEAIAQLVEEFPDIHVLIIGGQVIGDPHPYEKTLTQNIHRLGLENHVTLTGYRDDTPELLGLIDVFTLPTFTHEGLPRSILEAMAMELPVVATDIRGCREAVRHRETGLIVPPCNATALAAALRTLLRNHQLRKAWGRAARQRVEVEYDERLIFRRLEIAYAQFGAPVPPFSSISNSGEKCVF
jgi:glycosyltransferase involved in cell wall biosynthesis